MPRGRDVSSLLRPLSEKPIQAYFGQGLHTLGLLQWILRQTGRCSVFVSSYSTSEPFLNGFFLLRRRGLVARSAILLDNRAARKTVQLEELLSNSFDAVFLGQNHSKVLLVHNSSWQVSVVTSQNQTYGNRAESTIVTTDGGVYDQLMRQFTDSCGTGAVEIDVKNGKGIITEDRGACRSAVDTPADWRPFGVEF